MDRFGGNRHYLRSRNWSEASNVRFSVVLDFHPRERQRPQSLQSSTLFAFAESRKQNVSTELAA